MALFVRYIPTALGGGSGGGGGVTNMGTFDGQAGAAEGASIVGSDLFMQSATALVPGSVNLSTQTFTGQKTFATGLTGTLTGHATLDVPLSSLGNLTDAGTDGIIVTGGTGATVGSVSLAQHVADTTHNGYLSSIDWNTFNGKQGAGNYITALTGDVTATGPGSVAATLATVNSNVGSFGDSSHIPSFTVNAKGLVTAASSTAATATPAASIFAAWDANNNFAANNLLPGYATTVTAAGTTVLTVGSAEQQYFTGSTTQTVTLPVTSTLVLGQSFIIVNKSSGVVTVNSSGANVVQAMAANTQLYVTCILASGTTAASWSAQYTAAASLGSVTSVAATVPSVLSISGSPITSSGTLAISYSGTALPIANGGTAVTAVTTAPTASSFAGWDASANLSADNFLSGYTTTATAAGTTTLVVGDKQQQYFTGATTQTVLLPVASTLVLGFSFIITNLSSGVVTVQSSGANTIQAMAANSQIVVTCILTSGTGTASWSWAYYPVGNAALPLTNPMTTGGDIIYGAAAGVPTRLANGTAAQYLASAGGTSPPAWTSFAAPVATKYTSTGTTTGYLFTVTSANATVGATYTNNGNTYTVLGTIAAGTQLFTSQAAAPAASGTLTKSAGTGDATITFSTSVALATHTVSTSPRAPLYVRARVVGGGGGGGATTTGTGTAGGISAFGPNLLVGNGGAGGPQGVSNVGGAGGTATLGSGIVGINVSGGAGGSSFANITPTTVMAGGAGGSSYFGGAGRGGNNGLGTAGAANSGSGGGAASDGTSAGSAAGGGAGGYAEAIVSTVAATFPYCVGASGAGGSGSGQAGSAGGTGVVIIEEFFQ